MNSEQLEQRARSVRRLAGVVGGEVTVAYLKGSVYVFRTGHPCLSNLFAHGARWVGVFNASASLVQIFETLRGKVPRRGK